MHNHQPQQQILLLKLLHIPVFILKKLIYLICILSYLPNYFIIYFLDNYIIFNIKLQSTLKIYIISWLIRFIAINLVFSMFIMQINIIYHLLDIEQKQWYIQLLIMGVVLISALMLMRKGYLKTIDKLQLNEKKLKSPSEHFIMYIQFVYDVLCILLTVINIILLKNSMKTFSYQYYSHSNTFIHHIIILIHSSLLYNLTFFYLKIFFRLFSWRLYYHKEQVQKQQNNQNILNLMVLLTLMYWWTLMDLVVVGGLGWMVIGHWKRKVYVREMGKQERKWKVTVKYVGKIIVQGVEMGMVLGCFFMNYGPSKELMRKVVQYEKRDQQVSEQHSKQQQYYQQQQQFTPQLFFSQCLYHIYYTSLKPLRHLSFISILIFKYKHHKFSSIISSKQPHQFTFYHQIDNLIIKLFFQQIIDGFYVILLMLTFLMKPWNYHIFDRKFIIDEKFDLKRKMIVKYAQKCLKDVFWGVVSIFLTIWASFYMLKEIIIVIKGYLIMYKAKIIIQRVQQESLIKKYVQGLIIRLKKDFWCLPFYFIMKINLVTLLQPDLSPQNSFLTFQKLLKIYYIYKVNKSPRAELYFQMYKSDLASGLLQSQRQKMRFWKFANKCQRHRIFFSIISFLVPKKRYIKHITTLSLSKPTKFSTISNEYWYHYTITNKMLQILIKFIIQLIISLFGLLCLTPLTLWRFPTFIIIYKQHNRKRLFFKIIFQVYKVMLLDFMTFGMNLFGLVSSPVKYLKFRKNMWMKYTDKGYEELVKVQQMKHKYVIKVLGVMQVRIMWVLMQVGVIVIGYLRKKAYFNQLKARKVNFGQIKSILFKGIQPPTFQQLIQPNFSTKNLINLGHLPSITSKHTKQTLLDIPYLFISFFIFMIMPWRIYYIKYVLIAIKQDKNQRYKILILLKNVFKDYLCILLNLLLIFSVIKSKKGVIMMWKNYRLNFFGGFLKYSFLKELIYQCKQIVLIYYSIILIIISIIINWPSTSKIITQLYKFYQNYRDSFLSHQQNLKIYQTTVKQKKDLQIITKLGFYQFIKLMQFLDINDMINISMTCKINYLMMESEQVWIEKWEGKYSGKYERIIKGDGYKERCIKAYMLEKVNKKEDFSRRLFIANIYGPKTNFPLLIKKYLSFSIQLKLFKNYSWSIDDGYGAQQLLLKQNQDIEFLHMIGQQRKQKQQIKSEKLFYYNLLVISPVEGIIRCLGGFYDVDTKRKLKQGSFLILCLILVYLMIKMGYGLVVTLFVQVSEYIGVRLLFYVYGVYSVGILMYRVYFSVQLRWVALTPFDLVIDIVEFVRIKINQFNNFITSKVYTPMKTKLIKFVKFIKYWAQKIINFIISKTKQYSKTVMDKVITPTYIYIAHKIILLKKLCILFYHTTYKFIKLVIKYLSQFLTSIYKILTIFIKNMNKLYFSILLESRIKLMKFGLFGELIFTFFGLFLMTLPSIICLLIYNERWYVIVSTGNTILLIIVGYRHLKRIKEQMRQ